MALNIKNERVHDLAREAARRAGTTQTSAMETALERYVAALTEGASAVEDKHARAREIVDHMRAAMTDTDGDAMRRELVEMYDEDGLPA